MFLIPSNATELVQAVYVFITYNLAVTIVYTAINLLLQYHLRNDEIRIEKIQYQYLSYGHSHISNLLYPAATLPLINLLGDTQKAWIK